MINKEKTSLFLDKCFRVLFALVFFINIVILVLDNNLNPKEIITRVFVIILSGCFYFWVDYEIKKRYMDKIQDLEEI